jgi:hypothetical protein
MMPKNDLDTLTLKLGQSLAPARRAGSKVLVHLIQMALLELASIQVSSDRARVTIPKISVGRRRLATRQ